MRLWERKRLYEHVCFVDDERISDHQSLFTSTLLFLAVLARATATLGTVIGRIAPSLHFGKKYRYFYDKKNSSDVPRGWPA